MNITKKEQQELKLLRLMNSCESRINRASAEIDAYQWCLDLLKEIEVDDPSSEEKITNIGKDISFAESHDGLNDEPIPEELRKFP